MSIRASRSALFGWLLAGFALLAQISGAVAMPAMDGDGPAWLGTICSADHAATPAERAPHHHHAPDCAVCPFCAAMAVHAPLPVPAPLVPPPPVVQRVAAALPPPARGPPPAPSLAGKPRGPPVRA